MNSKKRRLFKTIFGGVDDPKKAVVNSAMVVLTALWSILYSMGIMALSPYHNIFTGLFYILKYIPFILTAAFGGAVPGLMAVLIVFIQKSIVSSSFSYLTFIYLLLVIVVEALAKRKAFKKWYTTVPAAIVVMFVDGFFWGIMLWLLSGKSMDTIDPNVLFNCFLNELPGSFISCFIVYFVYKRMSVKNKRLISNGKYYIDKELLTEEEEYEISNRSRISRVILGIVVFEAIILGVSAEIASNTLIPTMKYTYAANRPQINIEEDYSHIKNAGILESRVSFKLSREAEKSAELEKQLSLGVGLKDSQFSVKLSMLISIIVIPIAVFVNRYAQRRIAEPIRALSKAVSKMYNANDQKINTEANELHNLDISTRDEIEELYHTVDLTFYKLVDYIELVRTRQTIEDQLISEKSANEAKSRFLSNISHEIRTPINAVLGFDEMILRQTNDPEVLQYATDIQNSGKTLLALINDILDFSKIEAGKLEIIPVEYETASVINDLVNMANVRANDKQLKFIVNVSENIPHILFGDEVRIRQCVINLITNAIKYTEKGSVTLDIDYEDVETDNPDESDEDRILLKIKVSDTGIGIREEDIDKLSTAFERIDEKRNRTIEGTGLGINIVNSLLAMMDSSLNVQSEYGKGSVFSFEVVQSVVDREPIGDFSTSYKDSIRNADRYQASFHAPDASILVVDDTKTNLTVIEGLLKMTQLNIDTATGGREALEMVKQKAYDLIFLDHRMPDMDGIQTFHAMQELEDNLCKDTPIIALTANAISGSREMYLQEGFSGYMSKPVAPGKLEEMILSYLPKDKVSLPGDEDYVQDTEENDKENAVMQELLKINGIDVQAAISRCGSATVAIEVMNDFRLAIEERAGFIERYKNDEDIANYTIYVHGLKSSARAIGALELSDRAEYLEKCGNEYNIDEIDDLTGPLLELYRSYLTKLAPLSNESDVDKPVIDPEELEGAFASIKEFIEGSYFDSADDIMKMLEEYSIPEDYKAKYSEVKRLMAAVDRDGLLNIL
ncbi:response regulator [Butyrivibrio sp. DSM 10294]|uniref:response regulator n=1 Tax=Butyrivibrio sp. DSM 10294 TaxID=2972457 RepID=UPI00234E9658|nr:response regulator [Butyrivibrio sp. DSM 10294]MDC7294658.1 response regulator [Butyrivibrio sp. DSM 10294]